MLAVSQVSCEHVSHILRASDNAHMTSHMTRRFDSEHRAIFGYGCAAGERTDCRAGKLERFRIKPNRPSMWNRAGQTTHAFGKSEALVRSKDSVVRKMTESARMIVMQVRQYHQPHVGRSNAHRVQLRSDLFFRRNLDFDVPKTRVEPRHVTAV